DRAVCMVILRFDYLQLHRASIPMVEEGSFQRKRSVHRRNVRQRRNVAGTLRDHRSQPAQRLPAFVVGYVLSDEDRLYDVRRNDWTLLQPFVPVYSLPAYDLDI